MQTTYCPYCLRMVQTEICPYCGNDVNYPGNPMQLPVGYILNGQHPYILGAAIGQGGFGITYIALDAVTGNRVAIKEYFPTHCSGRNNATTVQSYLGQEEVFHKGKEHFLLEAQTLQSLASLKSIVNVQDYFEANNSAYLVMEFLEGCSLKDYVEQHGKLPAQQFLLQLRPLMEDIEAMHQRGVIHRDIAPDNIMLQPDGTMKLIDFGAARSYLGDKSMTVVVKKGFAPVEQYMRKGSGTCTDVYALAATIYYCVTGQVPPDSAERQYGEARLDSPRTYGAELTDWQVSALAQALEIQPKTRTQRMSQLANGLYGSAEQQQIPKESPVTENHTRQKEKTVIPPVTPVERLKPVTPIYEGTKTGPLDTLLSKKWFIPAVAAALILLLCLAVGLLINSRKPSTVRYESPSGHTQAEVPSQPRTEVLQTPSGEWKSNVLMLDDTLDSLIVFGHEDGAKYEFLNTGYMRNEITAITFLDHLNDVPGKYWDVSEDKNQSVVAWADTGNSGVHIYIAADGGINGGAACKYLFAGCENLTTINFNNALHTDEATNMHGMFCYCKSLTSLDLRSFNTANVTDMCWMFNSCKNLTKLDLSSFDTSKVVDMGYMFSNCDSFTYLDVSSFDTSSVTDMGSMFSNCGDLLRMDIRHFDTSQVTNMGSMFACCFDMEQVDLTGIDTSKVKSMMQMFRFNHKLTQVKGIGNLNTSSLDNVKYMFGDCELIQDLELNWNISLLKKGKASEYEDFMMEGKKINGKSWQTYFK